MNSNYSLLFFLPRACTLIPGLLGLFLQTDFHAGESPVQRITKENWRKTWSLWQFTDGLCLRFTLFPQSHFVINNRFWAVRENPQWTDDKKPQQGWHGSHGCFNTTSGRVDPASLVFNSHDTLPGVGSGEVNKPSSIFKYLLGPKEIRKPGRRRN